MIAAVLLSLLAAGAQAAPGRSELEGVWVAVAVERGGKMLDEATVARTRYTFKGDRLLVRGNYGNDREDEFTVAIDASDTPKAIDLTDGNGYSTAGIYELAGDVLTLCLAQGERPATCTRETPRVTRLVLKRAAPPEASGSPARRLRLKGRASARP
jgi:uncharacterized protein (TIGR03067 family)